MRRLRAAVIGNLERHMAAETARAERATTRGVTRGTNGLKGDLRGQVVNAGLGRRLANAWRGKVYPRGQQSMNAAGFVYSNAAEIHGAFDDGAVIRPTDRFLAIPTEAAGKRAMGKRMTPEVWEQSTGRRLRFVYRRNGPSLLVAEMRARTGKRGGFSATISERTRRTGRGLATVPIFILVKQVRLRKRLDVAAAERRWAGRTPHLILEEWDRAER